MLPTLSMFVYGLCPSYRQVSVEKKRGKFKTRSQTVPNICQKFCLNCAHRLNLTIQIYIERVKCANRANTRVKCTQRAVLDLS